MQVDVFLITQVFLLLGNDGVGFRQLTTSTFMRDRRAEERERSERGMGRERVKEREKGVKRIEGSVIVAHTCTSVIEKLWEG